MGATSLSEYFTPAGQQRALEAYGRFATGTAWSVPMKMELYAESRKAFGGGGAPEGDALAAFTKIYQNLKSYWQVFRSSKRITPWTAERTFDEFRTRLDAFSQSSGVTLRSFSDSGLQQELIKALKPLKPLKPTTDYPTMAVSKFLHFFNPKLFPIYDTAVIDNSVFKRFRRDYRACCASADLDPAANGPKFLGNYVMWGSKLLQDAGPAFMDGFIGWLRDELPPQVFRNTGEADLRQLEATAFEFTIIGAAEVERETSATP